jgi:hypothetical protein
MKAAQAPGLHQVHAYASQLPNCQESIQEEGRRTNEAKKGRLAGTIRSNEQATRARRQLE